MFAHGPRQQSPIGFVGNHARHSSVRALQQIRQGRKRGLRTSAKASPKSALSHDLCGWNRSARKKPSWECSIQRGRLRRQKSIAGRLRNGLPARIPYEGMRGPSSAPVGVIYTIGGKQLPAGLRLRFVNAENRLPLLDRLAFCRQNFQDAAPFRRGDLIEELHRLHDTELRAGINRIALFDKVRFAGSGREIKHPDERRIDRHRICGWRNRRSIFRGRRSLVRRRRC